MSHDNSTFLIVKPRAGIHPNQVAIYLPRRTFWPNSLGQSDTYDDLDDDSPMREYAWAFLRRNRFFQQQQDMDAKGQAPQFAGSLWGFNVGIGWERSSGLRSDTKYWQPYRYLTRNEAGKDVQEHVRWLIVDIIQQRYEHLDTLHGRTVKADRHQVAVVFDLAPMCGPTSAIDLQIAIAREHINTLARDLHENLANKKANSVKDPIPNKETIPGKKSNSNKPKSEGAHRSHLRDLLRIIDLFSDEELPALKMVSAKYLKYAKEQALKREPEVLRLKQKKLAALRDKELDLERRKKQPDVSGSALAKIQEVEQELERERDKISKRQTPQKDMTFEEANSRVLRLMTEAFAYVYKGDFLKLLPLDPWPWNDSSSRGHPATRSETQNKESRVA